MSMGMGMQRAIAVFVFVLVENNLHVPPEGVSDPAQGRQAWHMIAPFKAGNHRLGHLQARRQLLLCLSGMFAELEKPASALRGQRRAVVKVCVWRTVVL